MKIGYSVMAFLLLMISNSSSPGEVPPSSVCDNFETYSSWTDINGLGDWTAVNTCSGQYAKTAANPQSFFEEGSRILLYHDGNDGDVGPLAVSYNPIMPAPGAIRITFDFYIVNGIWNPTFWAYSESGDPAITLNFFRDENDGISVGTVRNNNGAGLNAVSGYVLSTDLWYRAELTVADISGSSDHYNLRIIEEDTDGGHEVINVKELPFRNDVSDIDHLTFNAGGASSGRSGTEFILDHISVERVPEPAWKTYYVKVNGDESADGLSWAGATTLTGARDKIRSLAGTWAGNIEVIMAGGFYCLTNGPLVFDECDSGKDGYTVIYRNKEGTFPAISRSQQVDVPWEVYGSGMFWRSSPDFADLDFREMATVINGSGIPAVLAHSDAVICDAALLKDDADHPNTIWVSKSQLVTDAAQALSWGHPLEIKIYNKWSCTIVGIESIEQPIGDYAYLIPRTSERNRMFNTSPCTTYTGDYYDIYYTSPSRLYSYCFQNSAKFIDEEGEFYKEGSYLYYKPRSGETLTNLTVLAPLGARVMEVSGATADNRAHDIVFRGINFSDNTWTYPTAYGFLGLQAIGHYDHSGARSRIPLAVLVQNADRIDFTYCRFYRLATTALGFFKSTAGCDVEGCYFRNVGSTAIELYGAASTQDASQFDTENEYVENCRIVNNYMKSCGSVYTMTPAIVGVTGPGHLVSHNEIDGGAYSGISWGWGLNRLDYANAPLWDNELKANYIHDTFEYVQDGAGIYTFGNHQDSLWIFENYIKDLQRSPYAESVQPICGLYFDNGTYDVIAQRNVLENIDTNWPSVFFHSYGTSTTFSDGTPINPPITAEESEYYYNVASIDNTISDQIVKDRAGLQTEWLDIKNWTAAPSPEIENVALNRKVSASSSADSIYANYLPDRGIDGLTNTIWSSGREPVGAKPEYTVEFNRPVALGRVELVSRQGWDQPVARRNFIVEGSTNGTVWVQLASQESDAFPADSTWDACISDSTAFSYVRLRKTVAEGMNFAELRLLNR
ncbi:MAG: discoidin domain-containing protein [Kiritimatiellales bacterium]